METEVQMMQVEDRAVAYPPLLARPMYVSRADSDGHDGSEMSELSFDDSDYDLEEESSDGNSWDEDLVIPVLVAPAQRWLRD